MGSLQKTALCLLFLSISSGASSGQFAEFKCSDVIEKGYNETATMSCTSKKMNITKVSVWRCESCSETESSSDPFINTIRGKYFTQEKRIYVELRGLEVVLHIQKTKVSDQGGYKWYLASHNGFESLCTTLKIRGPETEPNVTVNGAELVCQSAIGHQQRQIHWFDGHGTNLTSSAHLVSKEAEDGLTRLTSTLHEEPNLNASEYCCTVLYDAHTKRNKTKCLSTDVAVNYFHFPSLPDPDTSKLSREHVATILVLLFLVFCSFAAVLYYRYRLREASKRDFADLMRSLFPLLRQREKTEENPPLQEV